MEERDAAQHRRARPPRERLDDLLGPYAERALTGRALDGVGRDRAVPVLRLEAADHVTRATAHRVAILAKRAELDLARELRDFGAGHADAEVAPRDGQALGPALVVDQLCARAQDRVDEDVLAPRDVKHEPRQ